MVEFIFEKYFFESYDNGWDCEVITEEVDWSIAAGHRETRVCLHSSREAMAGEIIRTRRRTGDPDSIGGGGVGGFWADDMRSSECRAMESEFFRRHHGHEPRENQCSSTLIKPIKAPVHLVWSFVRRFDQPQKYKPFVSRCVVKGDFEIGSVREVNVKSGLPATTSTERLELLDDNEHILGIKIVGGDHRLQNYSSVITVHPEIIDGRPGTLVIESFVVDVPEGNTKDETCFFVEALIKCNLKSLAHVSERLAVEDQTEPIDVICT